MKRMPTQQPGYVPHVTYAIRHAHSRFTFPGLSTPSARLRWRMAKKARFPRQLWTRRPVLLAACARRSALTMQSHSKSAKCPIAARSRSQWLTPGIAWPAAPVGQLAAPTRSGFRRNSLTNKSWKISGCTLIPRKRRFSDGRLS